MRRSAALLALGLASLVAAQYPGAVPPPKEFKKGFDSISEYDARSILGYLAGPETEGRGTGQIGFQRAAEFVAAQFKAAGLKPLGDDGGYFQYGGTYYRPVAEDTKLTTPDGAVLDDRMLALTPTGKDLNISAAVTVIRAGATDELTPRQLDAIDGKIVILDVPEGRVRARSQVNLKSPAIVLTVADRARTITPNRMGSATPSGATPRGQISREAVDDLSPAIGAFMAQAGTGARMAELARKATLVSKGRVEAVRVPNVVGMIEGSDPKLKAEYIGVGGHLDHLGIVNGVVNPGADDDGSGSTAVCLVARAIAANPVKPKRSIVFMTFYGEELGLLGSRYLTDHPPVPLDKMVAELQMDMVGRDSDGVQNGDESRVDKREENVDTIRLVGSKRISTELDSTIQSVNKYVGFRFKYDAEDVYTRSDHYNFARKGIPIAFLFDGFHPDYHQPTDTIEKIDFPKLANAARLYYLTAMTIANQPLPPKKDVPQNGG